MRPVSPRAAPSLEVSVLGVTLAVLLLLVVVVLAHGGGRLPHLQHIVVGDRGNDPLVVAVPRKVNDFVRVAGVEKEQLRRPVFGVLGILLLSDRVEVPQAQAAVRAARGKKKRTRQ